MPNITQIYNTLKYLGTVWIRLKITPGMREISQNNLLGCFSPKKAVYGYAMNQE